MSTIFSHISISVSDKYSTSAKKSLSHWLAAFSLSIPFSFAHALDIQVTKGSDSFDGTCDSDCSLREAVQLANQTPGPHIIHLVGGDYFLSLPATVNGNDILDEDNNVNGDLDVASQITILGVGQDETILDADNTDRFFEVLANASLNLRSLTLTNGLHSHDGGAIRNSGILKLKDVRVIGNLVRHASGQNAFGGAVANYGDANISRTEFTDNHVLMPEEASSFGGAIFNQNILVIKDSSFRVNSAAAPGWSNQRSGGAIHNRGNADIARAIFAGNSSDGDGVALINEVDGSMVLSNTTLSRNFSSGDRDVGVLSNNGKLTIMHVTIADNLRAWGVFNRSDLLVRNSIIIGNRDYDRQYPRNCVNDGNAYTYKAKGLLVGNNYLTLPGVCQGEKMLNDAVAFTQVLAPLALNGSTLDTMALRPGSPALDAGVGSCSSHDQRSLPRPVDGNQDGTPICDLGAYERQANE